MDGKRSALRAGFISRRGVKRKTTPSSTIPNGIEGKGYLKASEEAGHKPLYRCPWTPVDRPGKLNPVPALGGSARSSLQGLSTPERGLRTPSQLKRDRRSSHSLSKRTRCRHASKILSSCSWIRSQVPLSVVRCCADHVSMRCRRRCVRNQRGTVLSSHSGRVCKVFESGKKVINHPNSLRAQSGGSSSESCPTDQPSPLRVLIA